MVVSFHGFSGLLPEYNLLGVEVVMVPWWAWVAAALRIDHPEIIAPTVANPRWWKYRSVTTHRAIRAAPVVVAIKDTPWSPRRRPLDKRELGPLVTRPCVTLVWRVVRPWIPVKINPCPVCENVSTNALRMIVNHTSIRNEVARVSVMYKGISHVQGTDQSVLLPTRLGEQRFSEKHDIASLVVWRMD